MSIVLRPPRGPVALIVLGLGAALPAHASDCRPAPGLAVGLNKLMHAFETAASDNEGLTARDFLIGVSGVAAKDIADLNRRGPVIMVPQNEQSGTVRNAGPQALEFEGTFAGRATFFRVPRAIAGGYMIGRNSVTLTYESGGAMAFGESLPLVGFRVFRTVNHLTLEPKKLSVFFGDNDGPEPDRCYLPQ